MARITALLAVVALFLALYNISLWTLQIQVTRLEMLRRWGEEDALVVVVGVGGGGGNGNGNGNGAAEVEGGGDRRAGEVVLNDRHDEDRHSPVVAAVAAVPSPSAPEQLTATKDQETTNDRSSFSSCLLWMDDNFRMTEWIAYHYYMMNLRYLVVHPDPRSKTSPEPILERWKDRMTIEVWRNFTSFTGRTYDGGTETEPADMGKEEPGVPEGEIIRRRTGVFFERQAEFYKSCAMHLKTKGRKWVSFHDNDEFIVVTPQANVTRNDIDQPGIVPKVVNTHARDEFRATDPNLTRTVTDVDWNTWFSTQPCVNLPRALFSAINSTDEEVSKEVPSFLDARRFDTFAWRHQGTPRDRCDGPGKSIVDVSRLPDDAPARTGGADTLHRPFGDLCTHAWRTADSLPLLVHHYLGSWEAFSYRDDVRKGLARSIEKWKDQSTWNNGGINDEARVWIRGFVAMVGEDAARELLKDAGLPPGTRKSANDTNEWTLKGEDTWSI